TNALRAGDYATQNNLASQVPCSNNPNTNTPSELCEAQSSTEVANVKRRGQSVASLLDRGWRSQTEGGNCPSDWSDTHHSDNNDSRDDNPSESQVPSSTKYLTRDEQRIINLRKIINDPTVPRAERRRAQKELCARQ
ncbi:MAG: hypothetical protein K2J74_06895, partial [Muribaculaceae bacterium]|nr:hypothetical protein [Muribaculaceae bacterium]